MSTHIKTLLFVSGVCLGIVCGEVSPFSTEVAICMFSLAMVEGVIYIMERKRKPVSGGEASTHQFSFSLLTLLLCFGIFVGILREQLVTEKTNFVCKTSCIFSAKIISSPETKNEYQIFSVQPLGSNNEMYDIQVRTPLYPRFEIGDTLNLSGKVTVPAVIMPHDATKNSSSGFDYASYLRTKNIGSEIFYPRVEVMDIEAHTLTDILGRWKESLVTRTNLYVSQPASMLASGMLFGASSVSQELLQTFRTAGLSHIIVLSGFNIVIVISSILFVLAFLPLVVRIFLASVSVILFVMMVGGGASVVRATLMAFIALLALLVGRAYVARQALILSLLAIILYEPYSLIHDVSLQLSFLATMGLVYMSEPLGVFFENYFSKIKMVTLRELFVTTLSAYFATLPYVMYTFGTASVYALVANILVVPFVPLAMLLSFFVVVSSYVSETVAVIFGFLDTMLINVMIWVAQAIEGLPFSTVPISISFLSMCVTYVFIFILMRYFFQKKKNETPVTKERGILIDRISF